MPRSSSKRRSGSATTGTTRLCTASRRAPAKLGVDQIDLLILHQALPSEFDKTLEAYRALETLLADGKVRAIGVSNFMVDHLTALLDKATVVPAVNQIEVHPYFPQREVQAFGAEHGILTQAWSPIGGITFYRDGSHGSTLQDPVIGEIARAHGKTPAQVMLRWHLQQGRSVIPKSTKPHRIAENFDVFDFELATTNWPRSTTSTPTSAAALSRPTSPWKASAGRSPKPDLGVRTDRTSPYWWVMTDDAEAPERVQIDWIRAIAGALAAVASALLLSTLGAAGTIIGAAIGSLVVTVGSAMFTKGIATSKRKLSKQQKDAAEKVDIAHAEVLRAARADDTEAQESHLDHAEERLAEAREDLDEVIEATSPVGWRERLSRLPWKHIWLVTLGLFLASMALITAFELVAGRSVSSITGGSESGDTTIGHVSRPDSGEDEPQDRDDQPTERHQPERGGGRPASRPRARRPRTPSRRPLSTRRRRRPRQSPTPTPAETTAP